MEFEIVHDEAPKRKTAVKLVKEEHRVSLMAQGTDGWWFYIVSLESDGMLKRHSEVPKSLGFPLDSEGHVETWNE